MSALLSWDTVTAVLGVGSLALLGLGYFSKGPERHALRIAGWVAFAVYWPLQSVNYFLPDHPIAAALAGIGVHPSVTPQDDPVNGYFTLLAPAFFGFLAWHEHLSRKWGEDPKALRWITGTAFIAGATYFLIYQIPGMQDVMINAVAQQSSWVVTHLFGVPSSVYVDPGATSTESRYNICLNTTSYCPTTGTAYAVTIILACTAIQSVMIFVGAIFCTEGASRNRLAKSYLYTAPTIYFLNLLRNAGIVYGFRVVGWNPLAGSVDTFELWHSYIGKGGSLLALVLIALAVFKTLPELHNNILDLFDLPKRKRPGFFGGTPPEPEPPALPADPRTPDLPGPSPASLPAEGK